MAARNQRKPAAAKDTSAVGAEVRTLRITDLNNLGCGVGRLDDGAVCFVRGAITGDTVTAKIIKRTASYTVGRLETIVSPSPLRDNEVFCQAPEACGGCVYRHLSYEHELAAKHDRVKHAFRQAGLPEVDILSPLAVKDRDGVPKTSRYRNKGMYPVRAGKGGLEAGFFAAQTHKVIPVHDCSLQPAVFGEIVRHICRFCDEHRIPAYDELTGKGVLRHIYLRAAADGSLMICPVIRADALPGGKKVTEAFVDGLLAAFPRTVSIQLNINLKATNVVLGDRFVTLYGADHLEDVLCGKRFRISGGSFYQVNRDAAELLYHTAMEMAGLRGGEHLLDLYCGAGTIGISMSDRVADVTGIEIVPEAVACAKVNAALNGLTPDRARFFCGDASNARALLSSLEENGAPTPDLVVIDPPRKGTTAELIREISERDIRRVVYISCEPETLARDCAVFRSFGYAIGAVQPVDLFPRTGHVESVVTLTRDSRADGHGGGTDQRGAD